MIKYLDMDNFLNLIPSKGVVADIRKIEEDDIKNILQEVDQENTTIEKQIGFIIPNNFKGKVITTGNFSPIELGDIVIIKHNEEQYITVLEEVV